MDVDIYQKRFTAAAERAAIFDYNDLSHLTDEEVDAVKSLVGWRGDEDFYERSPDPAKRAVRLLLKMRNTAVSIQKDAMGAAASATVRGPAISPNPTGA